MIPSAEHEAWPGDVRVDDFEGTGLLRPCTVRTAKIANVEESRCERIGRVPPTTLNAVRALVRESLGEEPAA